MPQSTEESPITKRAGTRGSELDGFGAVEMVLVGSGGENLGLLKMVNGSG